MKNLSGESLLEGSGGKMTLPFEQGDILKVESIKPPVLVVSKNFFNQSEQAVVCPIVTENRPDPLHIAVKAGSVEGWAWCERMKLIDLRYRGYKTISRTDYSDIINITDAIQSIFDY